MELSGFSAAVFCWVLLESEHCVGSWECRFLPPSILSLFGPDTCAHNKVRADFRAWKVIFKMNKYINVSKPSSVELQQDYACCEL